MPGRQPWKVASRGGVFFCLGKLYTVLCEVIFGFLWGVPQAPQFHRGPDTQPQRSVLVFSIIP